MTPNDRFALELGRAVVRALVAEATLAQAQDEIIRLTEENQRLDPGPPEPGKPAPEPD